MVCKQFSENKLFILINLKLFLTNELGFLRKLLENLSSLNKFYDSWDIAQFLKQPNLQNSFTEINARLKHNDKK